MRNRLALVAVAALAGIAAVPAHAGGTPKLDGKKVTSLSFTDAATMQDNDSHLATGAPDFTTCGAPECFRYSFVYKPAKGVAPGPVSVKITWGTPGQDYDLYVYDGSAEAAHCGAAAGTGEVVVIDAPVAKHTYTVIVDNYRSAGDNVKGTVTFPAKDKVPGTIPAVDNLNPTNCGLA